MKWKAAMLVIGILLGALVARAIGQRGGDNRPWLQPANPTQLEWLALEKQATEGNTVFVDGMTINFYTGPESIHTGVIYCDIDYARDVSAARVQLVEEAIEGRFEKERKIYPWARVKIIKKPAPFDSN
jgi:hypothetical protein